MRAVDPALQAALDGGVTTLCRCWALTRTDGVSLGFTDHDGDLSFEGITFRAESGLTAFAMERSSGMSVDNGQAMGALSSVGLREGDLLAGVYDGATVVHWLVDWTDPARRLVEFRGTLGEIRRSGGAFEAELRGIAEGLNQPQGRALVRSCERALGDAACGVDVSDPAYAGPAEVVQAAGRREVFLSGLDGFEPGWFRHGQLVWTSGANFGQVGRVKGDAVEGGLRRIELWLEMPYPVSAGDAVRAVAGCDKRVETCRAKFDNVLNFRGFPHVPGDDWVTAYPAKGGNHSGLSLLKAR